MKYESTRAKTGDEKISFEEACFTAFSKDGGIMVWIHNLDIKIIILFF